ncbi:hypothetical protein EDB89DRAFT_1907895 [Lactarius sanguifluus]|nr:hypothetical protein EDB89DRAFT_1907895 [Lactarius sanguifluus]
MNPTLTSAYASEMMGEYWVNAEPAVAETAECWHGVLRVRPQAHKHRPLSRLAERMRPEAMLEAQLSDAVLLISDIYNAAEGYCSWLDEEVHRGKVQGKWIVSALYNIGSLRLSPCPFSLYLSERPGVVRECLGVAEVDSSQDLRCMTSERPTHTRAEGVQVAICPYLTQCQSFERCSHSEQVASSKLVTFWIVLLLVLLFSELPVLHAVWRARTIHNTRAERRRSWIRCESKRDREQRQVEGDGSENSRAGVKPLERSWARWEKAGVLSNSSELRNL